MLRAVLGRADPTLGKSKGPDGHGESHPTVFHVRFSSQEGQVEHGKTETEDARTS